MHHITYLYMNQKTLIAFRMCVRVLGLGTMDAAPLHLSVSAG